MVQDNKSAIWVDKGRAQAKQYYNLIVRPQFAVEFHTGFVSNFNRFQLSSSFFCLVQAVNLWVTEDFSCAKNRLDVVLATGPVLGWQPKMM
jgi:hypothetical protein